MYWAEKRRISCKGDESEVFEGRWIVKRLTQSNSAGDVKVIHAANDNIFNLVGVNVFVVRRNLADAFNLPQQAIPFVNGVQVALDYRLQNSDILEFVVPNCRKGSMDDHDQYSQRSTDALVKLNELIFRMGRLEQLVTEVLKQEGPSKEFYTVEEFGKLVELSSYTVREHCRLGRLQAVKAAGGRGGIPEWRIPHAELVRYRSHGLLPLRKHGS